MGQLMTLACGEEERPRPNDSLVSLVMVSCYTSRNADVPFTLGSYLSLDPTAGYFVSCSIFLCLSLPSMLLMLHASRTMWLSFMFPSKLQ